MLQLVHTNLCGPITLASNGSNGIFPNSLMTIVEKLGVIFCKASQRHSHSLKVLECKLKKKQTFKSFKFR